MSDAEAIRQFEHAGWERAADTYEASFAPATRQFVSDLLDAAGVGPGNAVLDIACGPGHVTKAAAEQGAAACGLDFSAAMLRVARGRYPGLTFDQGDAEHLPYADGAFDAVISNFGIHHVPRPALAIGEAFRVLRGGGRIAFTIWAAPSENKAWGLVFDAIRACGDPAASKAPPPGGRFGAPADCIRVLEDGGFSGAAVRQLRGVWRLADGAALLAAMRAGTARMAGLIEAQDPACLPMIAAWIDREAAAYRAASELRIPISAFAAAARRP
ncbi:MAG: class I SAM-dependent methyltransferase [Rhodopila sp.]